MNVFSFVWKKFESQPDIWFFYLFLATFTLSVRKVLFFYPIAEHFNEWSGIYFYLSDLFLVLILIAWLRYILKHNKSYLSIDNLIIWLSKAIILCPLILVLWSFLSIFWADNQVIALFRSIKILEFYFLYLYVIFRVAPDFTDGVKMFHVKQFNDGTIIKNTVRIIIFLGFIQAIIGIFQFVLQKSIGLFWLFESHIGPNIDGVAKIVLGGEKYIRAYGLFPHPNILGGFLLFSIILTWAYGKVFNSHLTGLNCSTWNNLITPGPNRNLAIHFDCFKIKLKQFFIKFIKIFHSLDYPKSPGMTILFIFQFTALILTFSKSAMLGLILALGLITWKYNNLLQSDKYKHVPRGTFIFKIILLAIILILSLYSIDLDFGENLKSSFFSRSEEINFLFEMVSNNKLLGSGIGQYVIELENVSRGTLEFWQYQPVHNVFLLILSELGFVGLFIFLFFILKLAFYKEKSLNCLDYRKMFHMEHFNFSKFPLAEILTKISKSVLISFMFIMFFDHYFWDIQQGQILLWLMLGVISGLSLSSQRYLTKTN